MTTTTSLKLSDELKASIAEIAAIQGKTSHALMVETLETAMSDAKLRQEFYAAGYASYEEGMRTNVCYGKDEVHAYIRATVRGENHPRPKPRPLDPSRPMILE